MVLQPLGKLDGIILIKRLEGRSERNVVFLLDEQIIVRLVDNGKVELLGADEVWLGQWQVVRSLENLDDSSVVKSRCKHSEKVGKEVGLVCEL